MLVPGHYSWCPRNGTPCLLHMTTGDTPSASHFPGAADLGSEVRTLYIGRRGIERANEKETRAARFGITGTPDIQDFPTSLGSCVRDSSVCRVRKLRYLSSKVISSLH